MQEALKILMFGWELPPNHSGGLGMACQGIVTGLQAAGGVKLSFVLPALLGGEDLGGAAVLLAPATSGATHGGADGKPCLPGSYGSGLLEAAGAYARSALAMAGGDFDIVHAHDWLTAGAGIAVKQASGKPLVLHIHSTEYDRAGQHADRRIVAIETRAMETADLIVAVSDYTRRMIVECYGQPAGKVRTIYNGITPSPVRLRERANPGCRTVSFLGRITHQKGPAYFVEAAALALKMEPELQFVMAGDGDLLAAMQRRARELGIEDRIAFPGFLRGDEVRHLLDHSDIYVMPSVSEPFGISALEAIDAGVPAILSRQSGVVELFDHVLKVDHWDVAAIAGQIVRLARDPALADRLRRGAMRELHGHDWSACAAALKASYRRLRETESALAPHC